MVHGLTSKFFLFLVLLQSTLWGSAGSIEPYLLPNDHPIKERLDALFSKSRVTFNRKSLIEAGFRSNTPRKYTSLIVTTHPAFPEYIFKLYLDNQRYQHRKPELYLWVLRVQGAQKVREAIAAYGFEDIMKVPEKWVYALPKKTKPPKGYYPSYYILVEENMDLLSNRENKRKWSSDEVSKELLECVYTILKAVGLDDCAKVDNIPFSVDGKIAFIDTQSFGSKDVPFERLNNFLSASNRDYWKEITGQ